jgi:anaerobic magnesium-protoporphyrin IX monomethyl ester cyclase
VPDRDWLTKVKDYDPDVVCYSVTTGMHLYFADINRKVRRSCPTRSRLRRARTRPSCPEYIETEGIDAICRGEGEPRWSSCSTSLARGEDYRDA